MIEEAYGCAAWVMREHPNLTESSLCAKNVMGQIRPCVAKTKDEKRIDRIDEKMARLARTQPQMLAARQLVFGAMAKRAALAKTMQQHAALKATQRCMR